MGAGDPNARDEQIRSFLKLAHSMSPTSFLPALFSEALGAALTAALGL